MKLFTLLIIFISLFGCNKISDRDKFVYSECTKTDFMYERGPMWFNVYDCSGVDLSSVGLNK